MQKTRAEFGSADDIEAGRIALDEKRVIRAGGGYGEIVLVIHNNVVVESHTKITRRHREKKRG